MVGRTTKGHKKTGVIHVLFEVTVVMVSGEALCHNPHLTFQICAVYCMAIIPQ